MFTPSERALGALRRVARITERPVSAVVSEQIEVLVDHLEGLATILEKVKAMRAEEPQAVAAAAKAAFLQMMPILEEAGTDVQLIWDDLADQFELLTENEGGDPGHPLPPASNTGATSSRPPSLKAASNA